MVRGAPCAPGAKSPSKAVVRKKISSLVPRYETGSPGDTGVTTGKGGRAVQNKVEICGVNTSRLPVLKNEETMELLRKAKQGDMQAREKLIAGNLRLVLSVIQRFSNRGRTPTTCSRWAASA